MKTAVAAEIYVSLVFIAQLPFVGGNCNCKIKVVRWVIFSAHPLSFYNLVNKYNSTIEEPTLREEAWQSRQTILQPADIGWPTGKKLSNSQPCCLAQLSLAAA